MNKSAILMILPCVIAVAIVVVEGQLMTSGVGYSGLGGYGSYGSYGAAGVGRQQYQQRYLQEFLKARQQRNQLNALAKQSTFANFVNYSKSNWTHLKKQFFVRTCKCFLLRRNIKSSIVLLSSNVSVLHSSSPGSSPDHPHQQHRSPHDWLDVRLGNVQGK